MQDYFESLVVPVDFGPKTSLVIKQAFILGQLMNCDVVLLYVHNPEINNYEGAMEAASVQLHELANTAQMKYNHPFFPVMKDGDVTKCIVDFATSAYARMIVMGNNSESASSEKNISHIGANTGKIIREAECPVLTISSDIIYDLDKMLLPLDLSKPVDQKLNWAIYFSRIFGCIIKIITIAPDNNKLKNEKLTEKMFGIKTILNDCNVFCTTDILYTNNSNENNSKIIISYARKNDCDLIMIMTQQEDKKKEMQVGRTASGIISLSEKPVISITPHVHSEIVKNF